MTGTRAIEAQREEGISIDDLQGLPFKEKHKDGSYSVNASVDNIDRAERELDKAGADYRVFVYATNDDGNRYPVFINEGRNNGIGADGLSEILSTSELPDLIEEYTHGLVSSDELAFIQMEFVKEHHRE